MNYFDNGREKIDHVAECGAARERREARRHGHDSIRADLVVHTQVDRNRGADAKSKERVSVARHARLNGLVGVFIALVCESFERCRSPGLWPLGRFVATAATIPFI